MAAKEGQKYLSSAVLKYELEVLASLQGRYQHRLCHPGRAYQFALVHYTQCSGVGMLSSSPLPQLQEAANANHQTMAIRLVTHAARILAVLLTA